MWADVRGGGRQQWWDLDPQHWRRLHRHLHRDRPCHRHSWSWILVNSPFFTSFSTVCGSYLFCPPGITSIKPHQHESALSRYKAPANKFFCLKEKTSQIIVAKTFFLRSRQERRKTMEHLSSGSDKTNSYETWIESVKTTPRTDHSDMAPVANPW